MVLAFCRRGSVIPICFYLLVGRYMKEGKSGLRHESSKTKRTKKLLFKNLDIHKILFHFPTVLHVKNPGRITTEKETRASESKEEPLSPEKRGL